MWNIDFKNIMNEYCVSPTELGRRAAAKLKEVKPVSPKDLQREKDALFQKSVDEWVVRLNTLLRSGYRSYSTTPIALPSEVLVEINTLYRAAGWKVSIIRHDKVLTLEFSEA